MSVGIQVWSTTASNNSTADTNINFAEGMAPSQVNDSARALMASAAKWRDDNNGSIVTGGSTTAYTVTSNQVEAALTAGYTIAFQIHATNDSSATLNVDGLGAKPLQITAGTNLQGGELTVGNIYRATYSTSGTGQWIVNNYVLPVTANLSDGIITYNKIQQPSASVLLGNPSTSTSTGYREITLGTNLSFSGTILNAGNNTPVVTTITSTATTTWQSTTQNGNFPLYLLVRMVAGGGGGAGAGGSPTSGSSGTISSFNNWTVVQGAGGAVAGTRVAGGTGGTNGTGTLIRRLTGGDGRRTAELGIGGGTALSPGTATADGNNPGQNGAVNTGAGGSSAISGNAATGGGGGGEYVEFIVTSPSTSYTLQCGAGGAGGTGNAAGGNGAAGRIEVIAYWQ